MKFYRLTYRAKGKIEKIINKNGDRFESFFDSLPDEVSQLSGGNAKAFISSYSGHRVNIAAVVREGSIEDYTDIINSYIPSGISDEAETEEITCSRFSSYLDSADHLNEFDSDDIRKEIGIVRVFGGFVRSCISADEKFIGEEPGKYSSSSLDEEIGRIRASGKPDVEYNPVHYIIGANSVKNRDNMLSVLLNELNANGRLSQSRYTVVSVTNYHNSPRALAEELKVFFEIGRGGTVVFNMKWDITGSDGRISYVRDLMSEFCRVAEKYEKHTLCIFLLPANSEKIFSSVSGMMPDTAFVKITEDALSGGMAKKYLSSLAKADSIRADRSLYKEIKDGTCFYLDELESIYDAWYKKAVVNKNFPAYSGFIEECTAVKKPLKDEAPEGNAYEELMSMVGLKEAKEVINEAIDFFRARKLFADKGFKASRPSMHMVFTGAPGTAKTTAARLFARIMKDNGVLSTGAFIEVGRADLVGQYVGWTAQTVKDRFRDAEGGVLFIDEAYSLVDDRSGSFGDEAINTIVQEMENHRDDIIVIFAGYSDRMEGFLNKNPGLRSRIAFHVPFDDYSADELYGIAELIAKNDGFVLGTGVKEKLLPIMEAASMQNDFGNGRFVRNLMEKARLKQAGRLIRQSHKIVTREQLTTLIPEDFEMPVMTAEKKPLRPAIGF